MHPEAFAYVATKVRELGPFADVVEFGSRDINGSVRSLFPLAAYLGIDIEPGPGVDFVANAARYRTAVGHDCVVCLETLEHTAEAQQIIGAAWEVLRSNGALIVTMACDPRAPHSASDGGLVQPGEYYRNVDPDELAAWLADFKDVDIEVHTDRGDLYAVARKP